MLTKTQGEVYWQWGPFALTSEGLNFGWRLLARAWIAVCLMILLINTTPFDRILEAMRAFKVPSIFVMLLSFLYRYLYLLWDEVEHMQRARNVRYFGGRLTSQGRWLGSMATSLFIRSYDRADRVQKAMEARGWNGETPPTRFSPLSVTDWSVLIVGSAGIIGLWLIRGL
jgi:cobalt/nickel transport system permease protein